MDLHSVIAKAAAAHAAGDLNAAVRFCREVLAGHPRNADATHLLGLIARRSGDMAHAETLIRASIDYSPSRAEFRSNLGNLLRATGRAAAARQEYERALAIDPSHRNARLALVRVLNEAGEGTRAASDARQLIAANPGDFEAWSALGVAQRSLEDTAGAETSLKQALALRPDYAAAHHNLGALLASLGRPEEALTELERAAGLGLGGPELKLNRARVFIDLARFDEADAALRAMVRESPLDREAQLELAKLRHMRRDPDYTRALREAAATTRDAGLWALLGDVLRRGGQLEESLAVIEAIAQSIGWSPSLGAAHAVVLQEMGRIDEALAQIRRSHAARPEDRVIVENLVSILLQVGEGALAGKLAAQQRVRFPYDQRWLAYEATAARLTGSDLYQRLFDYDRFVRMYELDPPDGFESTAAFNAELALRLATRHELDAHPLDQSLRFGTQTSRSLLTDPDPVIRAFIDQARRVVERYRREIGHDGEHPFLSRNAGNASFSGCWSVRLHRNGFHVSHIHPKGWISSAYYVEVPPEAANPERRAGWLAFGAPRMPVPGMGPAMQIEPRPGHLVLFPSYMWHGTNPILESNPRMTIAFDVVTDVSPVDGRIFAGRPGGAPR